MKKHTFLLLTVITILVGTVSAWAVDGGSSARQGSLFNGESGKRYEAVYEGGPWPVSIGAYSFYQKRGISHDDEFVDDWRARYLMAYLGVDLFPWLTVQGGVGQSDLSLNQDDSRDADLAWMGGAQIRILDYMLMEPIVGDDTYWFALDSYSQYLGSRSESRFSDVTWTEIFSSLTMSLTSHPERFGFMDRISIFFGPAVSFIQGRDDDEDFSQDKSIGFVGGIQFVPSDNLTFKFEVQQFDEMSFGGGVGFHF